jgi:hypothetical protein
LVPFQQADDSHADVGCRLEGQWEGRLLTDPPHKREWIASIEGALQRRKLIEADAERPCI